MKLLTTYLGAFGFENRAQLLLIGHLAATVLHHGDRELVGKMGIDKPKRKVRDTLELRKGTL